MRIFCVILTLTLLTGCAGSSAAAESPIAMSPEQAAEILLNESGLGDLSTMTLLPSHLAENFYSFGDGIAEFAIYTDGSGATAREVAVLKVTHSQYVRAARETLETRIRALAREFENYRPSEMAKINNPIVEVRGNLIFMVLTDSPAEARSAIDTNFG